jgi:hypothetical protein
MKLRGTLVVLAVCDAVGCGSSSGGAATGPVPLDLFASALVDAECARDVRCGVVSDLALCHQLYTAGIPGFTPGVLVGLNPWVYARADFNSVPAIVAAVNAGKAHYDPVAARACLNAAAAVACNLIRDWPASLGGVCRKAFTGTIAVGDHCISDLECLPGSFCAPGINACDGICTSAGAYCNFDEQCPGAQACQAMALGQNTGAPAGGSCVTAVPPGAAGQSCGTSVLCQPDLYCAGGACMPTSQEGQPCIANVDPSGGCAGGLICVSDDLGANATCLKPAASGASCQFKAQCGGMFSSLACDETQHRCAAWVAGGPCNLGFPNCPATAYCDTAAPGRSVCRSDPPLGSACVDDGSTIRPCGFALHMACVRTDPAAPAGTCQPDLPPTCTP